MNHPVIEFYPRRESDRCHPLIRSIPNWQEKVCLAWPPAARLRRNMLRRGIKLGLPKPINNANAEWSEWQHLLNAARSNIAVHSASTYGIPIYCSKTKTTTKHPDRNEFWDNPSLLKLL